MDGDLTRRNGIEQKVILGKVIKLRLSKVAGSNELKACASQALVHAPGYIKKKVVGVPKEKHEFEQRLEWLSINWP